MKKLLCVLFLVFAINFVYADGCPLFSVDYIEDDGSLRTIECFDDFNNAESKRNELGDDYVVRSEKSLSPSKIVSMGKGFAYTYSSRSGTSLQNIYESINENHNGSGVTTYLTSHYEMTYYGTIFYTEYFGYSGGFVKVTMNGFTGYADLEYVDLVPMKYITNELPIILGGNDKTNYNEEPYKIICKQNYYEKVKNGNYYDLVFNFYRSWSANEKDPVSSSIPIGVAPSFMDEGMKYYSNDGINFYKDRELSDLAGTYYNYYQFLPVRTKTNISAETINNFLYEKGKDNSIIKGKAEDFINNQNKYGVNAATILSMAIHESAWGTSNIARNKNNLFGWGAYDDNTSNASSYSSVADCVAAQMGDNLANYLDSSSTGLYYSMSLGNKGGGFITKYASDPYWAEKISRYYYELDKYSKNYDGNLTDYNSVKLALVNKITNVKSSNTENSSTLYTTENKKTSYQKNLIVPVIEIGEVYTKINTSNPISGGEVIYPIKMPKGTLAEYSFDDSIGYISNSDLTPLNYETNIPSVPEAKDSQVLTYVEKIDINDGLLYIKGNGVITLYNYNSPESTKYDLIVKNRETSETYKTFNLATVKEEGISFNDGYNYDYCGFEGSFSINELEPNTYLLFLRITNEVTEEIQLRSFAIDNVVLNDNLSYRITQNTVYGNRLELEVQDTPIDYKTINKPESRNSLFAFDDLKIVEDDKEVMLLVDATSMIYYLNYNNKDNLKYTVYLIKDKNDFLETAATNNSCILNYASIFDSEYNMDNICFTAKVNISSLEGTYKMLLKIQNGEYVDYINMSTSNMDFESLVHNEKTYEIIKNNIGQTSLNINSLN